MAIDPASPGSVSSSAAAATTSAARAAADKLGGDYQSFLKLLTAQVANQDPLAPMDSTTFVSQLAQLSQVEQSIATNTNLEGIATRLASAGAMADVQLIGREVSVATDRIELKDGKASYGYDLAGTAASVEAEIRGADGTLLRRIPGLPAGEGGQSFTWDGLDGAGLPVPDGTFRVSIKALDADGEAISYTGFARTRVEDLHFETGESVLRLANGLTTTSASVRTVF